MLKKLLLLSLCAFATFPETLLSHPPDHADDRGGNTNLTCRYGRVERAGVAIVKDYGQSALRFAVIVGADRKRTYTIKTTNQVVDYVNFFGGACEKGDNYSTVTAAEELYEETGKAIDIPSSDLQRGGNNYYGYAYSGDSASTNTKGKNYTQMFFVRKDDASVSDINKAISAANKNPNLGNRFKDNKSAYAIPLQDILDRARVIYALEASGQSSYNEKYYIFETRGKGDGTGRTTVYLDPQYMRNLARDIARDPKNLTDICKRITGGAVK